MNSQVVSQGEQSYNCDEDFVQVTSEIRRAYLRAMLSRRHKYSNITLRQRRLNVKSVVQVSRTGHENFDLSIDLSCITLLWDVTERAASRSSGP